MWLTFLELDILFELTKKILGLVAATDAPPSLAPNHLQIVFETPDVLDLTWALDIGLLQGLGFGFIIWSYIRSYALRLNPPYHLLADFELFRLSFPITLRLHFHLFFGRSLTQFEFALGSFLQLFLSNINVTNAVGLGSGEPLDLA